MSAPSPFHKLFSISVRELSKDEIHLLEGDLFTRLCKELMENISLQYQTYLSLIKTNNEKENPMNETFLIRSVVNDILASQEYTLPGIAYYTDTPEEIIADISAGRNISPSFALGRKILELHRSIRPNLYRSIIDKIKDEITRDTPKPGAELYVIK